MSDKNRLINELCESIAGEQPEEVISSLGVLLISVAHNCNSPVKLTNELGSLQVILTSHQTDPLAFDDEITKRESDTSTIKNYMKFIELINSSNEEDIEKACLNDSEMSYCMQIYNSLRRQ
ncbi:hypothetical protein [Vibrio barjaei]|uniref:hypothetical protein n=1 Tax=Vibrio barjaei TaxID=1676683 RepID=UPI002284D647|nr:hypothetical protein [Vibrio barjaei]MCY9873833.1 hypothetical protein [Vibrio barjaei]